MAVRVRSDAVMAAVTRVLSTTMRRYVHDPVVLEDLCHEGLARVLAAADHLDDDVLPAYATVVAQNLVRSHARTERNRQAKHDRAAATAAATVPPPDEAWSRTDPTEAAAMRTALAQLLASDRDLLTAIDVGEQSVGDIADRHGAREGTVRVRVLRARARLRTRYLVALRRVDLPTDRCLVVLDALSAGDRTRQRDLHVDEHLDDCETCASLAESLVSRRRPALLVIFAPVIAWWRWLHRSPGPAAASTAVVAAGLGLVAVLVVSGASTPPPPSALATTTTATTTATTATTATTSVTSAGAAATPTPAGLRTPTQVLLPVPAGLAASVGEPITATSVPVLEVVGDESFWVGTSDTDRLLVTLVGGTESAPTIGAGQTVSFTGTLTAVDAALVAQLGIDESEGAGLLLAQGVAIAVAEDTVTSAG